MMDRQTPKFTLKTVRHKKESLGIRATVAASLQGKEIFRDEVKLWQAKSRTTFAKRCIEAIQRELGEKGEASTIEKFAEIIEDQLLREENRLRSCTQSAESGGPLGGDDRTQAASEPPFEFIQGVSLTTVHCAVQEIASSPHWGDILELMLACLINAARTEDGLTWLFVVGAPSSGKTEIIRGASHEPRVYSLDTLTDHAFVSGFVHEDGNSPPDLLAELDGKCLVMKDLSPLFSARPEVTKAIIGQMVAIYDGSYAVKFGTKGKVAYEARFSLVACITPKALQKHQTYMQELGSRPLFYRVPSLGQEEREEGMDMILRGDKRKDSIEHYRLMCSSYAHILLNGDLPDVSLTEEQREALKRMATLLARGRAISVSEPSWLGDEEMRKNLQTEEPFRILSQLRALSIALALVHKRQEATEHEIELVRRVVLSTLPLNRASVLTLFQNPANLTPEGGLTVTVCAQGTGLSDNGAANILDTLVHLGILQVDSAQKEHHYAPLPEFTDLLTKPVEPLDHVADLALVDRPHTNEGFPGGEEACPESDSTGMQ